MYHCRTNLWYNINIRVARMKTERFTEMVMEVDGDATETSEATVVAENPWITRTQAMEIIGVSRGKLALLIATHHIGTRRNVFNRSQVLVSRADAERVARDGIEGMRPQRRKASV